MTTATTEQAYVIWKYHGKDMYDDNVIGSILIGPPGHHMSILSAKWRAETWKLSNLDSRGRARKTASLREDPQKPFVEWLEGIGFRKIEFQE